MADDSCVSLDKVKHSMLPSAFFLKRFILHLNRRNFGIVFMKELRAFEI